MMDIRDRALVKIAIDALRAVQRGKPDRQIDLWQLAIGRILDTETGIEADEEIAAMRRPIPRAPSEAV